MLQCKSVNPSHIAKPQVMKLGRLISKSSSDTKGLLEL